MRARGFRPQPRQDRRPRHITRHAPGHTTPLGSQAESRHSARRLSQVEVTKRSQFRRRAPFPEEPQCPGTRTRLPPGRTEGHDSLQPTRECGKAVTDAHRWWSWRVRLLSRLPGSKGLVPHNAQNSTEYHLDYAVHNRMICTPSSSRRESKSNTQNRRSGRTLGRCFDYAKWSDLARRQCAISAVMGGKLIVSLEVRAAPGRGVLCAGAGVAGTTHRHPILPR